LRATDLARAPVAVAAATPLRQALRSLERAEAAYVTVLLGSRKVGAIAAPDLELALRHGFGEFPVRDLLLGRATTVAAGCPMARIVHELYTAHRSLVVVQGASGAVIARPDLPSATPPEPSATDRDRVARRLQTRLEPAVGLWLRRVARQSRLAKAATYLVGGAIRDTLLGRATRDIDLVVEGDLSLLAGKLGREVESHSAFQTAVLWLDDGTRIDMARSRRESYASAATLPVVRPAPLDEDLRRRDFTINAMAVPLNPRGYGALIDPHGGLGDLRRRRIRVLHPLSFLEDPTRALRAVRLCVSRGLRMEPDTARLLEIARRTDVFDRLSGSRLRSEIDQLFSGPRPDEMLRAVVRSRLLAVTLPGVPTPAPGISPALRRVPALVRRYGAAAGPRSIRPWVVVVGMLLRRAEPSAADALVVRLQPGREEARALREVPLRLERFLRRLSRRGSAPRSSVYRICRDRSPEFLLMAASLTPRGELRRSVLRYLRSDAGARPEISGRDLLAAGIEPGPAIAAGLEAALMAKLDGGARTAGRQLRVAVARARRA